MLVRLLSTAALTGGLLAAPAQTGPAPSDTVLKYKVTIGTSSVIDLSAMGAGEQRNNAGFSGYLTMTLKDTTGGKALTAVLDSMVIDSAGQGLAMLQEAADSAKGSTWHGLLHKDGKIENLTLTQGGGGAQQFESMLAGFFPRGEAHTKKKGQTWSDTLNYTTESDAGAMSIVLVTNFTAAGEGMYHNAKALQINTTTTTTSAGSQVNQGGEMQIEGTGNGVGEYYVTKDGRYLGGTNTIDSEIQLTTSQAPLPIPLTQHTVITISSL